MSDLIGSLDDYYVNKNVIASSSTNTKAGSSSLSMTDFISLMMAEFQNQDIDNTASTTDMMNQLVQMSVMQAVEEVTDAASMIYSSSLVGKQVTLGEYNDKGELEKVVGTVTGTGNYNGEQVIFVNGGMYSMSDILAIGTLPDSKDADSPGGSTAEGAVDGENNTADAG